MVRVFSKGKLLIAFILTTMIFLLGFFLGLVIEDQRADAIDGLYKEHTIAFSSSQLQYEYIKEILSDESCTTVFDAYYVSLEDLDRTQKRLEIYAIDETIREDQFDLLKREYLLSEIKFWLLAKHIKETCDVNMIPILNFHGPSEDCQDCDEQNFILDYLKKKYKQQILIFSFGVIDTNEPMIALLRQSMKIDVLPTIVIGDLKFEGFTPKDELESFICATFDERPAECPTFASS